MGQDYAAIASELVRELGKFPAPSEAFILTRVKPGEERKEFRFRVALLRGFEELEVEKAAQEVSRNLGESSGYTGILELARAQEMAAKVLVADDPYERPDGTTTFHHIFTGGEQARQALTNSEMAQILNAYDVIKSKYSGMHTLAPVDLDEWIRALGDELLGASFLSHLDSSLWAPLLLIFAQRLARTLPSTQPTQSTSQGSSESGPTTSTGGIGTFTELPAMQSADGSVSFPTDRQLDPLEAAELAEKLK